MRVYLNQIQDQEVQAMACAKFSRSSKPFDENIKEIDKNVASDFNKKWAVNYGHASILDCANVCISIERVSMLAAKFIENFPLFNGQESSSRYMRFDEGTFEETCVCPFAENDERRLLMMRLMDFYKRSLPIQQKHIQDFNNVPEDDKIAMNAVKAKTFDIMRGYLPAGCKTQLALVTSFRSAKDHIEMMIRNPTPEIAEIGQELKKQCLETYPGAFEGLAKESHNKTADEYYDRKFWDSYYHWMVSTPNYFRCDMKSLNWTPNINRHSSKKFPPMFDVLNGDCTVMATIDFGSWRDIHRHRNCVQTFPLLEAFEFEDFYIDNLAPQLQSEAKSLIEEVQSVRKKYLNEFRYINQYFIPMGFKVLYQAKMNMSQLVYIMELRSKPTVHHTARQFINKIYDHIQKQQLKFVPLEYSDEGMSEPLKISVVRGKQA